VLHCEIGDGEERAGAVLDDLGDAIRGERDRDARLVARDPAAVETMRNGWRGTPAAEEVGDDVAFVTCRLDDDLK